MVLVDIKNHIVVEKFSRNNKKLNSLNCISRVDSFTNLLSFIKVGLPNQQTLEMVDFETILPRLDMKYAERVNEFVRSID